MGKLQHILTSGLPPGRPLFCPAPRPHRLSVVRTYCGHGIGDLFHCAPNVPHYAKNKAKGMMKVGEVFTIGGWVRGWGGRAGVPWGLCRAARCECLLDCASCVPPA